MLSYEALIVMKAKLEVDALTDLVHLTLDKVMPLMGVMPKSSSTGESAGSGDVGTNLGGLKFPWY